MFNVPQKQSNTNVKIGNESSMTAQEIIEQYGEMPKTKTNAWFEANCIASYPEVPQRAINGHAGGFPVKTADGFTVRLGSKAYAGVKASLKDISVSANNL